MTEKTPILLFLAASVVLIGGVILILGSDSADDPAGDRIETAGPKEMSEEGVIADLADPGIDDPDRDASDTNRPATVKIESFGAGSPRGAFRGRVITEANRPVSGARLYLFSTEGGLFAQQSRFTGLRAETNSQGEYTVEQIPVGGNYTFKCRSNDRAVSQAVCPAVKTGEIVPVADIVLHDGIILSGTVTDTEGNTLAGVRVTAVNRGDLDAGLPPDAGGHQGTSDGNGRYAIPYLGPFQYDVTAQADGFVPSTRSLLLGFLGNTDKEARLDLQIERGIHELSGRVQTREGKPVPRADVSVSVLAQGKAGRFAEETVADGKGAFRFDGLPGSRCLITASSRGHFLKSPVVLEPGSEDIVVTLDARGAVEGHVVARSVSEFGGSVTVRAVHPRWSLARTEKPAETTVRKNGRFRLENLVPGKYVLMARIEGFAWSASDEIEVVTARTTGDVEISLVRGGSIAGRLLDGKGRAAEGFEVRLMHKDHQPGLLFGLQERAPAEQDKSALSSADGTYSLENVLPGEYSLEITGDGMAGKLLRRIVVEEGKVFNTGTITITAGATLIGTAREMDGRPARGMRVVAMNQENGLCKTAVTDNNGFFRMNALAAGSYIVYLENNSWSDLGSRSDLVIQVREARTEKVELRVRPPNSGDK